MAKEHEETKQSKTYHSLEGLNFVKQLFFGKFDASQIFPYPRLRLEEKEHIDLYCHKLRQFCETFINPVLIDRESKIPQEVIHGLGKMGMLGLTIPIEYGGLGMSMTAYCKAMEVISQYCGSTSAFITAHQSIGFKAILLYGTPEQKKKWLPLLAKGEVIAAFALTEPNAGSDANGVETTATYNAEKNVFYLNGQKQWITNGSFAGVLTVMAKTNLETAHGKKERVTAFIVTPDMPGFKVTVPALDKIGLKGIQSTSLEFNNMEVPAENILGKLGEGLKIALSVLNYGRVTIGAGCAGPAKILVDHALKHARDRHQFGRSLSSFSLVKSKLAHLAALGYAIDAVTYLTAGKIDNREKDFMLEAAVVKVFSTEALSQMIFETMQIFGGRAMFTDLPYELMLRDSRPSMIVEGSNEVMKMFISGTGIKHVVHSLQEFFSSFKNPIVNGSELMKYLKHGFNLFLPSQIDVYSPLLKKEVSTLSSTTKKLGRSVIRSLIKNGNELSEMQQDLERIAEAVIYLYTTAAVISKLDSDLERVHGKVELLGEDIEIGQFFCQHALKIAQKQLNSLFNPEDKKANHLADKLIQDL